MFISRRAKVNSKNPAYKDKIKTENGFVWVYDDKHISARWKEKLKKLKNLEKNIDKLRKSYEKDLSSDDLRTRAEAAIVGIMDETAMRVGNEESARDAKTYGATTLLKKHVKISGNTATFSFPGKDNVQQHVKVTNSKIIKVIKELIKDKGPGDFIFEIEGKKIWDRAINRYLKDFNISAKDLRGFQANLLMKKKLKSKSFEDALEEVAEQVGHEPNTLKNQYLDPELVKKNIDKKAAISKRALSNDDLKYIDQLKEKYLGVKSKNKLPISKRMDKNPIRIRPGVSINTLILNAWRSLLPFLPDNAQMTSGIRTPKDQEKVIDYYWKKLSPKVQNKHIGLSYDQKADVLREHNFKIAAPGLSDHSKGIAFDVSGADLDQISKAINMVSDSTIPVRFKEPIVEGNNNAVHVVVHSAKYDPVAIAKVLQERNNGIATASLSKRSSGLIRLANDPIQKIINFRGIDVQIEWPKGSIRTWPNSDYKREMKCDYGYFANTVGEDGEEIDAYVGDDHDSDKVYIVKQIFKDGSFDEDKVMLGFSSEAAATEAYLKHMDEFKFGGITELSFDDFAKKLKKKEELVATSFISKRYKKAAEQVSLTQDEQKLFNLINDVIKKNNLNVTARAAGGWVRDKLLGKNTKDLDIAVEGMSGLDLAKEIQKYLQSQGESKKVGLIEANPDQSKHLETAVMNIYGIDIDFVGLRAEKYDDNSRIPKIVPGTLKEDADRRDLTINALYYNINDGVVEDPTGQGVYDIEAGIIRTPSSDDASINPVKTFMDDPLRILRAIRFAVRYNFKLDPSLIEAAKMPEVQEAFKNKISRERIEIELRKMITGPNPHEAMELIKNLGLREEVFRLPEGYNKFDMDQNNPWHDLNLWDHIVEVLRNLQEIIKDRDIDEADKFVVNLAALLHDIGKLDPSIIGVKEVEGKIKNTYHGHEEKSMSAAEYMLRHLPGVRVDEIERIKKLIDGARRINPDRQESTEIAKVTKRQLGRLVRLMGNDWEHAIDVAHADASAKKKDNLKNFSPNYYKTLKEKVKSYNPKEVIDMKPLLNGNDISKLFSRKPGPWVGVVLKELIDWQLEHTEATKSEAEAFVKSIYSEKDLDKTSSLSKRANDGDTKGTTQHKTTEQKEFEKDMEKTRGFAENNPKIYFDIYDPKYSTPELDELAASNYLKNFGAENYFRAHNIPKDKRTEKATKKAASLLATTDPYYFFGFNLDNIFPEFAINAAILFASRNPFKYDTFERLYEDPRYNEAKRVWGEKLLERFRFDEFGQPKYGFLTDPAFKDLKDKFVKQMALSGSFYYFEWGFDKDPDYNEYTQLAMEKSIQRNPYNFFKYKIYEKPEFAKYKEQAGLNLLYGGPDSFDEFVRLKLFLDPMFAEKAKIEINSINNYEYYFSIYEFQQYPQFIEKTREMAKKLLNLCTVDKEDFKTDGKTIYNDVGEPIIYDEYSYELAKRECREQNRQAVSEYMSYGLAGIPELHDITETISFIDEDLKEKYKLTTKSKENNFVSLTLSQFQSEQRNPSSIDESTGVRPKLYDFAINNPIGSNNNPLEDGVLSSIYHQTSQGVHDVGMRGTTKSFGLVSFPKKDELFLEEIQSDLPSVIYDIKNDENKQTQLIKKYGPEQYFKFINDATEHSAVYPYIVIQRAAEFAAANNITKIKISSVDAVAEFADIKNKEKLKKVYDKIPSKLGFKLEGDFTVYDGDMNELANKAKNAKDEVIKEMRQTKENTSKEISNRPVTKKPKLLDIDSAKAIVESVIGDRANQLNISENLAETLRSLDGLQKNKIITNKEKNEIISLLTKNIKAYLNYIIEKYAFNFNYTSYKKGKQMKLSKRAAVLTYTEIAEYSKKPESTIPRVEIPLDQLKKDMGDGIDDNPGDYFEKNRIFIDREKRPEYEEVDASEGEVQGIINDKPEEYFYRGLHRKYPKYERDALNKIMDTNAKFFFIFNYNDMPEFEDLLKLASEKLSQQDVRAFFYYKLHHLFPELGRGAIIQLIDTNPDSYFDLGLQSDYPDYQESANAARNIKDPNKVEIEGGVEVKKESSISKRTKFAIDEKTIDDVKKNKEFKFEEATPKENIPDLLDNRVKEIAHQKPFIYLLNLSEKYPKYIDMAAREVAYDMPELFFISNFDKKPEFADLLPIAAQGIAKSRPFIFFLKELNANPATKKFTGLALENLAEKDPKTFLNSHYARMPEFEELKQIALKNSHKFAFTSPLSKRLASKIY